MARPAGGRRGTAGSPFIVGVGASAGGLAALQRLLAPARRDAGVAIVVIQHLDPDQASTLARLLASHTRLPVLEAADGARIEGGHVYVSPAGQMVTAKDGFLHLTPRAPGLSYPIDTFLQSLAEDAGSRAAGVILTGTGHDGVAGVRAIHEHDGLVIVQDPEDAEFPGMPQHAIDTGLADLVLPVEQIIAEAERLAREGPAPPDGDGLRDAIEVLREVGPPDFTAYRPGTLERRMQRRMSLRGVSDAAAYVELLKNDPDEARQLHGDLLLGVTSFFRDPTVFRELEEHVLPRLVRPGDGPIRAWVAGCSLGHEAYSIAMLLAEHVAATGSRRRIQVFGTDINPQAIASARKGVYPASELAGISEERRRRFFEPWNGQFRVRRDLRATIAFAVHDLLSDPPLPAMDLVSCRNVLIYLAPEAQRRVLHAFHFSLAPGGFLLLGSSESASRASEAFDNVSPAGHIFRRRKATLKARRPAPARAPAARPKPIPQPSDMAQAWLLERHAPPAVAVDADRKVVHVHGAVEQYLRLPGGTPTLDVVALAQEPLRARLRSALHHAMQQTEATAVTAQTPAGTVRIGVEPIEDSDLFLVTFRDEAPPGPGLAQPSDEAVVQELENELLEVRQRLEDTVARSEASKEELRATSEEVTSMNEELRTTIEELEASKEEMASLNTELHAVNDRLTHESHTATVLLDDLSNLYASTGIPVVFLDRDLRVRRRTPATDRFFGAPVDEGMHVTKAPWLFRDADLVPDAQAVLDTLQPVTRLIHSQDGTRHRRRILPYRTSDDRIAGVVLVLEDVEALMRVEDDLRTAESYAAAIVATVPVPIMVLGEDLEIKQANPAFYAQFGLLPHAAEGQGLGAVLGPQWDVKALHEMVRDGAAGDHEADIKDTRDGQPCVFRLAARLIPPTGGRARLLVVVQDITDMKQVERDLVAFTARLHRRVEQQTLATAEKAEMLERVTYSIGHDLKEPVRSLRTLLRELVRHSASLSEEGRGLLMEADAESQRLARIMQGLLSFTHAMQEDVHNVHPVSVRAALASEDCRSRFDHLVRSRNVKMDIVGEDLHVLASLPSLGYILGNVIQNAILHNPADRAKVRVEVTPGPDGLVSVAVDDNGPGLPPDVVAAFQHKSVVGKGYGLAIAKQMTELLGGSMRLGSATAGGTRVQVFLPATPPDEEEQAADAT